MGTSSSTLITDPDSSATVPAAASTTVPDPYNSVLGGTTTHTPAPLGNLAALVLAVNTKLPAPSPSLPEPNPSQRVPPPSINSTPLPSINSTATPLPGPDPTKVIPVVTSTNTPAPVANVAVPDPSNIHLQTPSQEATALELKLQAAKLKLNVTLLHQKLQEAKARQLNMVPAGNIADKELPPIAKIVANEAKVTEQP